MKQRILGKTGYSISEVGLGCWQFGGDFGDIEAGNVGEIVDAALQSGINFFDSADVYGAGASESYLGKFLPKGGDKPFVVTKYGREDGVFPDGYTLQNLRDGVKRSQDRLQRDCLDLIQLHCIPTSELEGGAIFDQLREIKADGMVAHFGASVETMAEAVTCMRQDDLATLQIIFNVFRQKPMEEVLPMALENNVGVIVRLPLASGLLAGKMSVRTAFSESDHRNYNANGAAFSVGETFAGIPFATGIDLVEKVRALVPNDITMAQASQRWILDTPGVSAIITGASSPEQVRANASASDVAPLGADVHKALADLYVSEVKQHIRGGY